MCITNKLSVKSALALAFGIALFSPVAGVAQSVTGEASPVSYSIENEMVGRYLQDAASAYGAGIGRSGTSLLCYWLLGAEKSPYLYAVTETGGLPCDVEQCAPVTLPAVKGGKVQVSVTPTFKQPLEVSAQSTSVSVYNLLPQTVYWYRSFDAKGRKVKDGIFKTQGYERMIRTEKVLNVRDIGGWKCDGGRLAYGKIYRGAALEGITTEAGPVSAADIKEFTKTLGVEAEIDLRADAALSQSALGAGVTYQKIPMAHYMYVMENTPQGGTKGSGDYYSQMAEFVDCLVGNLKAGKGTYVHCTWGADRTGTALALVEALCGVSEADVVKDWELSSFNAVCYRKYINIQRLKYEYKDSKGKDVSETCELRAVFEYLYKNYGGASGASFKEQVTRWFKQNVFANRSDKGASVINDLRSLLIVPETKSPVIVKDLSKETDTYNYSVTTESAASFASNASKYVVPTTGGISDSDAFSCTDYIDCKDYSYLTLNAVCAQMGAFYDANKRFVGSLADASISNKHGSGAVIYDCRQYAIPSKAVYVRFNMPKYCESDWTAVLSVNSVL